MNQKECLNLRKIASLKGVFLLRRRRQFLRFTHEKTDPIRSIHARQSTTKKGIPKFRNLRAIKIGR